jgi:glyoxylase-like metal-dependent hydrolase (beta-lactamase superfamily II)
VVTYTGVVTPRGLSDVRELEHLTITKYAVDPEMANNCYLLTSKPDGSNLLIDAADGAESLIQICDGALDTIITTHRHWDHHRALAEMVEWTNATTVAGAPDADAITEQTGVTIDRRVGDGDTVVVGSCSLEVIRLTGHTPGSIALLYDDTASPGGHPHLFTGDSLFPGGVGNTFGDSDAFRQLIDDVSTKLFDRLPDDTWFYPGHGDDSTIGAERTHLAEWRERGW